MTYYVSSGTLNTTHTLLIYSPQLKISEHTRDCTVGTRYFKESMVQGQTIRAALTDSVQYWRTVADLCTDGLYSQFIISLVADAHKVRLFTTSVFL